MELFFHPYPWHAAACGDMDLTGVGNHSRTIATSYGMVGIAFMQPCDCPRRKEEDHCDHVGGLSDAAELDMAGRRGEAAGG